jgi:hypothetical protein
MKVIELFEDQFAEPESSKTQVDVHAIVKTLMEECHPFLQSIGFQPTKYKLFRGESLSKYNKTSHDEFVKVDSTRAGRKPKDTFLPWHEAFDAGFNEMFGHRYRSNATFCTADYNQAQNYATPYMIFPRGKTKACWSPIVDDMTSYFNLSNDDLGYHTMYQFMAKLDPKITKEIKAIILQTLKKEYQLILKAEDDDSSAARDELQAMFQGKKFDEHSLLETARDLYNTRLARYFQENPAVFQKGLAAFKYTEGTVGDYMKSSNKDHEVMVWSEKGYFGMDPEFFEKHISEVFDHVVKHGEFPTKAKSNVEDNTPGNRTTALLVSEITAKIKRFRHHDHSGGVHEFVDADGEGIFILDAPNLNRIKWIDADNVPASVRKSKNFKSFSPVINTYLNYKEGVRVTNSAILMQHLQYYYGDD